MLTLIVKWDNIKYIGTTCTLNLFNQKANIKAKIKKTTTITTLNPKTLLEDWKTVFLMALAIFYNVFCCVQVQLLAAGRLRPLVCALVSQLAGGRVAEELMDSRCIASLSEISADYYPVSS